RFIDIGHIDSKKMYDTGMKWDWGSSSSPDIYHDPETRKNSITYRKNLSRLADTLIVEGKPEKAKIILDLATEKLPVKYYGYFYKSEPLAEGYYRIGEKEKARKLAKELINRYQDDIVFYNSVDIPG